ncbi:MAG: hypothetical protein EKK54_02305 [Neisseriaceae bacterium]|nr:MAG: hypothetical protein EKK54_02305 [Neisseriaceae bacterium]
MSSFNFTDDRAREPVSVTNMALEECCIGHGIDAINFDSRYYYKLQVFKRQFNIYNSAGTAFESINRDKLNGLSFTTPNDEIIKSFEYIISRIDEEIYNNHLEVLNLQNPRDILLPKLISVEVNTSVGRYL